jgi:hypothetical protein
MHQKIETMSVNLTIYINHGVFGGKGGVFQSVVD